MCVYTKVTSLKICNALENKVKIYLINRNDRSRMHDVNNNKNNLELKSDLYKYKSQLNFNSLGK